MKKLIIMLADGFEEIEALTVVDVLRRADFECHMVALGELEVRGSHDIVVKADKSITEGNFFDYDGIILPGGMPGAKNLREDIKVIELVKEFYASGKLVAAICAAPIVLEKAGIVSGRSVTSYPSFKDELEHSLYKEDLVVRDENILTSRGPATTLAFAYEILNYFGAEDTAENLKEGMVYNLLKEKI